MFCCSCTEDAAAAENVVLVTAEDEGNLRAGGAPDGDPLTTPYRGNGAEDPDKATIVEAVSILDQTKADSLQPEPDPLAPDVQLRADSRRARGPKVREWRIQIEKTASLGIDIGKDKTSLLIGRVSEGPIEAWNAAEGLDPSKTVARGDRILEVNGVRGDAQEILQALGAATSLDISLSRLMEFRITNLPQDGALGIEFDLSISQYLVIKAIGEGSARAVSRKLRPDYELRPQDIILEVNGESGDASQLEAALNKTSLLTLLIRRPT